MAWSIWEYEYGDPEGGLVDTNPPTTDSPELLHTVSVGELAAALEAFAGPTRKRDVKMMPREMAAELFAEIRRQRAALGEDRNCQHCGGTGVMEPESGDPQLDTPYPCPACNARSAAVDGE